RTLPVNDPEILGIVSLLRFYPSTAKLGPCRGAPVSGESRNCGPGKARGQRKSGAAVNTQRSALSTQQRELSHQYSAIGTSTATPGGTNAKGAGFPTPSIFRISNWRGCSAPFPGRMFSQWNE